MKGETAAEKIGAFVASASTQVATPEVVHQTARAFVDTFAVAVAGRSEPATQIIRNYVLDGDCGGPSTLWTTGERTRPEDAATFNATAAHVLDFDDVTSPQRGHPSVVVLPALVALGEAQEVTGAQIGASYAVGLEVIVKMSRAMAMKHYTKGWHSTSTIGALGGAAGCAHLLGLDAQQATAAIGIAVAQAAGARRSFGTMTKSLQPATAAATAIRSARLAARGFTAPTDSLEGAFGFMDLYGNGEELDGELDTLGNVPLEVFRTGLEVKKYPCCYATHRVIQGILDMDAERRIRSSEVERVRVTVQPTGLVPLIHKRPWRGLEGKFSMEYVVAAAIVDKAVRLQSFTDSAVQRPEVQSLLRKVETVEESGEPWPRRALVEVELRNGETRSIRVEALRGSAQLPLSEGELAQKLHDCATYSHFEMDIDGFLSAAWNWADRPIRSILGDPRKAG